jgi:hypothetical protein
MNKHVYSPARSRKSMGGRVAVKLPGPGGAGHRIGGELPAPAEADVHGGVANAEREEALVLAGGREQLAHDAPDGRLPLRRQRRVAPDRRLAHFAAAAASAAPLLPRRRHNLRSQETRKMRHEHIAGDRDDSFRRQAKVPGQSAPSDRTSREGNARENKER